MDPIDTAEGYRDMLDKINGDPSTGRRKKGVKYLSARIGIPHATIARYLALLSESATVRRAIRQGIIIPSQLEEVRAIKDEKYREILKKALFTSSISSTDIRAMKRKINEDPGNIEKYIGQIMADKKASGNEVINFTSRMTDILSKNRLDNITDKFIYSVAEISVRSLKQKCDEWLAGKTEEKMIEAKTL